MKLRPLSGSSEIWRVVTTPPIVVAPRSIRLVSAVTGTKSMRPDTRSNRSTRTSRLTVTVTRSRVSLLKPGSSARSVYSPGLRLRRR